MEKRERCVERKVTSSVWEGYLEAVHDKAGKADGFVLGLTGQIQKFGIHPILRQRLS